MRGVYPLFLGFTGVVVYFIYAWYSKQVMTSRIFAIKVNSNNVNVEELAKQIDCVNEGPIGTLPRTYQFRYMGNEKEPSEWMRQQSNDIQWVEEQIPKMRYKRDDL